MNNKIRFGGVLLHPTSLPAKHGIGDLGSTAIHFIDFLERSRFGLWQILPLGPVGFGNSPYASRSSFAGNELLIDLDDLAAEGYLDLADVLEHPEFSQDRVDFTEVSDYKKPLLHKAARFFIEQEQSNEKQQAYRTFCSHQKSWLDDYALYAALCDYYQDSRWFKTWDPLLTKRDGKALKDWSKRLSIEIEEYKVLQYFFDIQWNALHTYATERHISIIGDIPIFVAHDSVDAWCNRTYLKMDDQGNALAISGVPPDAYSATGQLWGNPVYDWQALERDGFSWWVKRIRRALELTDIVRIDHFRGFEAYWEVPAGQKTA